MRGFGKLLFIGFIFLTPLFAFSQVEVAREELEQNLKALITEHGLARYSFSLGTNLDQLPLIFENLKNGRLKEVQFPRYPRDPLDREHVEVIDGSLCDVLRYDAKREVYYWDVGIYSRKPDARVGASLSWGIRPASLNDELDLRDGALADFKKFRGRLENLIAVTNAHSQRVAPETQRSRLFRFATRTCRVLLGLKL